ncbi:MAG: FG-GAP-like repeat-containing protein [candidate division Zixibacteria bacterium]|nr:FG-GAP-like repeat-containing protein [candidate division Zixibacteria bacterium]
MRKVASPQMAIGLSVIFLLLWLSVPTGIALALNPADSLYFEIVKTHPGSIFGVQTADIDRDGNMDIIFVGDINANIRIMYGMPDGHFETPVVYGFEGTTFTIGYINGDTLPDIATNFVYDIMVAVNDGSRNFAVDSISQPYSNLQGIATGYFNSDQYLDIAASGNIYLGDGNGNFPTIYEGRIPAQTVYVSDFNGDGIDDIIGIDWAGLAGIFLNDGNTNFTQSYSFNLGNFTAAVSITEPFADFNHDGNEDFAFITAMIPSSLAYVTIGYGDGAGGVIHMDTLSIYGYAWGMAITDVNRDNNLDLIVMDPTNREMVFFLGDGQGYFSNSLQVSFTTEPYAVALAPGDIDRDGNPDFVSGSTGEDSIKLFMNQLPDRPILDNRMITTVYSNASVAITNPDNFRLSRDFTTVAGAAFCRLDANQDNLIDQQSIDYNLQNGEYKLVFRKKPNAPAGSKFSGDINIGNIKATLFKDYDVPGSASDSLVFYYKVEPTSSIQPANGQTMAAGRPSFDWTGLIANPQPGYRYQIQLDRYYDFRAPIIDVGGLVSPKYISSAPLSPDIVYYWRVRTFDGADWTEYSHAFAVTAVTYIPGDVSGDDIANIRDITYLIDFLYRGGPSPIPPEAGDINCNGQTNIQDITHLIKFLYLGGAAPCGW